MFSILITQTENYFYLIMLNTGVSVVQINKFIELMFITL